ncbi:MAG TPA: endonuclease [Rubricoccaceae bacterium]|jgi:hypothetical protein
MRLAALAVLTLAAVAASAQVPSETLYPGQTGTALLTALRTNEAAAHTLGYGPARDSMYTYDQRTYGRVRCVYTGHTVTITLGPGHDASTDVFALGINAEHTYPQSQGAGSEPAMSDMHNLFPSRDNVNSSRGNLPFGESPDASSTNWYRLATNQTTIPTVAIAEWSERQGSTRFEPREDHKGNVARAMLYFAMRWPSASQSFLAPQIDDLVAWNDADPVDAAEYARMEYNQRLQGNRNPFVVDPTLARRAYRPATVAGEDGTVADVLALSLAGPNPVRFSTTLALTLAESAAAHVDVVDALGRVVATLHDGPLGAGQTRLGLDASALAPGVYVVRAHLGVEVTALRIVVVR